MPTTRKQKRKSQKVAAIADRKRNWFVHVTGRKPFVMLVMDGPLTQSEALIEARKIWPNAEVS